MGREDWLERFLDAKGTDTFTLVVGNTGDVWQPLYVKRHGLNVELGFYSSDGSETPEPGVRYTIISSGEWQPISTSDLGREWGGTYTWVRGQGEAFAKHIWYFKRWSHEVATIDWTGMTEDDKIEARAWSEERKKKAKAENDSNADDNNTNDNDTKREKYEQAAEKIRKECRGGCGAQNTEFRCSKCKGVYYCSSECQREDWKYHKSVCDIINETH
ncbi:hypothetical protein FIBSPDRAFT_846955 [Athelia psychrophila]|uniref:MYND-type domain-containing protein n=1 Tax=Athelia psychrophila TaxID=1759441 RepID=A0A166WIF6_9AGAM|nr:hypothetical protein FIBSPDRAFT_846955 [Fibularhizoctonia sp. CBS 109695]